MRDFLDWFDTKGFYVKKVWDLETDQWIGSGRLQLFPDQRRILEHVFSFNEDGELPYTLVVWSTVKKSGKSTVGSAVGAWQAEEGDNDEIFVIANDFDQAQGRQFADISFHFEMRGFSSPRNRIDLDNGTFVQVIANHATSAAGSRHVLSLWDELWGYQSERAQRMWAEMTPPPTVPNAFRMVTTYAGYENESNLLWDLYDRGWKDGEIIPELADIVNKQGDPICRRVGRLFVMWDDVPRFPWQTEQYYEDQLVTLRPADYLRMHCNQWVSSTEAFISIKLWDRAQTLKGQLSYMKEDRRYQYALSLGVDIGTKHDCSAVVASYIDKVTNRPGIGAHRIWTPSAEENFDIEETVEAYILDLWTRMNVTAVLYDPVQFHRSATTLRKRGINMIEFPQTVLNMTKATQTFYDLLKSKGMDVYPDDELRDHIKYSPAKQTPRGFRIVKNKHAKFKIDAAIALIMGLWHAVTITSAVDDLPLKIQVPFSDVSMMAPIPTIRDVQELKLPAQLRS